MATYMELRQLFSDGDLKNKIEVACIVSAEAIRTELASVPNHDNRLLWAKAAFSNPNSIREQMLMALLAANKDSTVAAIQSVTDGALQTLVDEAVDIFADGN